jgi:hypothetical protein
MKRKRFTKEQITEVLRLHGSRAKAVDHCRQQGISEATYTIGWPSRSVGRAPAEAFRGGESQAVLAEAMLDNAALKDLASGTSEAAARRRAVEHERPPAR